MAVKFRSIWSQMRTAVELQSSWAWLEGHRSAAVLLADYRTEDLCFGISSRHLGTRPACSAFKGSKGVTTHSKDGKHKISFC